MKRICIYGKGGIGKSTTVANVAAALAQQGQRVAVIGCDPKADSTRNLTDSRIKTVIECLLSEDEQLFVYGYKGIMCMESGGPEPGTGCAGRGIATALELIHDKSLLQDRDIVIYDVLGDVVCGGFSTPMREYAADQVYLVTTGDFMSLYAANNICRGIEKYALKGGVRLAGVIHNCRSTSGSHPIVKTFASAIGSNVIGTIPMSEQISMAEIRHKTVVEMYPDSETANVFRRLAQRMMDNHEGCIPKRITEEQLEEMYLRALGESVI